MYNNWIWYRQMNIVVKITETEDNTFIQPCPLSWAKKGFTPDKV